MPDGLPEDVLFRFREGPPGGIAEVEPHQERVPDALFLREVRSRSVRFHQLLEGGADYIGISPLTSIRYRRMWITLGPSPYNLMNQPVYSLSIKQHSGNRTLLAFSSTRKRLE
jgi:hypothetical protein